MEPLNKIWYEIPGELTFNKRYLINDRLEVKRARMIIDYEKNGKAIKQDCSEIRLKLTNNGYGFHIYIKGKTKTKHYDPEFLLMKAMEKSQRPRIVRLR